jgi:hypothetical protein
MASLRIRATGEQGNRMYHDYLKEEKLFRKWQGSSLKISVNLEIYADNSRKELQEERKRATQQVADWLLIELEHL